MARRFFDPEGLLWRPLGFAGELVTLSLLWGVCSVPLVTMGPAAAALYDCTVRNLRGGENELFARFFRTFKRELKTGALSTLLWALLLALPLLAYRLSAPALAGTAAGRALAVGVLVLLFFELAVLAWVFPLLSRFTFDFAGLNRTALLLALGHILRGALCALLGALGFLACYLFTSPLIFVPGLTALLWSYLMEPVFRRYESGEEGTS